MSPNRKAYYSGMIEAAMQSGVSGMAESYRNMMDAEELKELRKLKQDIVSAYETYVRTADYYHLTKVAQRAKEEM